MATAYLSPLSAPAQALGLTNPGWESAGRRWLIVRLSPFRDAQRSSPHLFLHALLRSVAGPNDYVDFAFFPAKADRAVRRKTGTAFLTGIQSQRPAADFDVLLVSCSYALELVNLPYLLVNSGLPPRASQRRNSSRSWPLLILGGSNALASQGAIFPDGDSFADGLFFGEGEAGAAELFASLRSSYGRLPAARLAAAEAACPAFWAAGFGPPDGPRGDGSIRKVAAGRCAVPADGAPFLPLDYPLLNSGEAATARLQLAWGCSAFCSFCFEGWERKPYRELPSGQVLAAARRLAAASGADTLELYAFNFNVHSGILALLEQLNRLFDRVNLMSQRADVLQRTPGMLDCELAAEKRSFTVGVEGISAGMRAYYAKGLTDADLFGLFGRLFRARIRELKLFFIIAGVETAADLADFERFCAALAEARQDAPTRVIVSAGYLVRMPFTPLGLASGPAAGDEQCGSGRDLVERTDFERLAAAIGRTARAYGCEFRLAMDWPEYAVDQLLVGGGYELAPALEAAAASGCAYDQGIEGDLLAGLRAAPFPPSRPSLAFVSAGAAPAFLRRAAAAAASREDLGTCLEGTCLGCAACADAAERLALTGHRVAPANPLAAERLAALIRAKRRSRPVYLRAELPAALAGATDAFLGAYLKRLIFAAAPGLVGKFWRIEDSLWRKSPWKERLGPSVTGWTVLAAFGGTGGERDLDAPDGPRLTESDAQALAAALAAGLGDRATGVAGLGGSGGGVEILAGPRPDAVARLDCRVEIAADDRAAALAAVRAWLARGRVNATERRLDDGGRFFQVAPKDVKKRTLTGAELRGAVLTVSGGPKLDLSGLGAVRVERLELAVD